MIKLHLPAIILSLGLLASCSNNRSQHLVTDLNDNWKFTSKSYNQAFNATIPGSIHTDLFTNNLIPDPNFGNNEEKLQWVDTLEWIYSKQFMKPINLDPNNNIEIIFQGLDTYADVFLNDSLLFSANNMFIPWKAKVHPACLKDTNILKVQFKPTQQEELKQYSKLKYELPGGSRVFSRKAAYHYGWDWGPTYITSGIWQDIELHTWNTAKFNKLNYSIEKLDSNIAVINLKSEIESTKEFSAKIDISAINQNLNYIFDTIEIKEGIHEYNLKVEIKNPKLWWTHNLGDPFLYHFELDLYNENKKLDNQKINIGLRTIELVQEKDDHGESFYFKVNNIPVFMKGANYIPQSSFPGIVTNEQYQKIIHDAKAANMNMLRVWGGGIYEKNIFYDLCDREGILIWQDFMFANAMYPKDSFFLDNINKEAHYQVERLSNHPSIAVWCGNNEMDEAWHNWGWSANYSKADSTEIWANYKNIFHQVLPGIVNELSPETPYTSSSPLFGRGNPRSSFEGDNHYWYVWHDAYDFDWYNKVTGRFMSEFGFQSFPQIETIELFDTSANNHIDSEVMLAHQKHHRGNFLINHHMKDYYPVPEKFKDFIYVSQLLQAEGIRTGILAQRRAKPFCMGSLYWQLNDCWPAISWSSIDFSGAWKALHYFAQQDFKNIIIDPYLNNDSLNIYIVSDSLKDIDIELKLTIYSFDGTRKESKEIKSLLLCNSSNIFYKSAISELLKSSEIHNSFMFIELYSNNTILDTRIVYFTQPKNLNLSEYNLDTNIKKIKGGFEIKLNTNTLIKNLYINVPVKGQFSDNYFDLIPGIEKTIIFKTMENISNIDDIIEIKSLNQIYLVNE